VVIYLTRKEHFNAAHRLFNPALSEEENDRLFGKCANRNYHGHNFDLYITVKGNPDPQTGFVINAQHLSRLIRSEVVDRLDHKNLNTEVPELENILCSTEHVAIQIWNWLVPHLKGCSLHCVKLQETENIFVEYFGP
jgi:6-pyruvoyltetrahydropterin/6-carboxytetrahydropterin synthase